jgi:hypothetical protein
MCPKVVKLYHEGAVMQTIAMRPTSHSTNPSPNSEEHELMMYNYEAFYSNKDGYASSKNGLVRFSLLHLTVEPLEQSIL